MAQAKKSVDIKNIRKLNGEDEWTNENVLSHIMELVSNYVMEDAEYYTYKIYKKDLIRKKNYELINYCTYRLIILHFHLIFKIKLIP